MNVSMLGKDRRIARSCVTTMWTGRRRRHDSSADDLDVAASVANLFDGCDGAHVGPRPTPPTSASSRDDVIGPYRAHPPVSGPSHHFQLVLFHGYLSA